MRSYKHSDSVEIKQNKREIRICVFYYRGVFDHNINIPHLGATHKRGVIIQDIYWLEIKIQ
jgi:hypothetical protein